MRLALAADSRRPQSGALRLPYRATQRCLWSTQGRAVFMWPPGRVSVRAPAAKGKLTRGVPTLQPGGTGRAPIRNRRRLHPASLPRLAARQRVLDTDSMEDTMTEQRSCSGRLAIAALGATAMLCLLVSDASAGMKVQKPLQPTVANPDATGQATSLIKGRGNTRKGKLRVSGLKLSPHTEYTVRLAGVPIGTLTTNAAGNGKAKFSTRPGPLEQPLGTDPFGKTVEVENDQGEDELDADRADAPLDPNDIQCCVDDGDETECEEMTADECTAANGTNLGAGSCAPDPCATDGEDIVCCLPGEDGADCEETDSGDCSQE